VTKKVLLVSCLLGLASTIPAYASPTSKTVTLSCSAGSPDAIIGQVDVILSDSSGALSVDCTSLLACDSTGGLVSPGAPSTNSTTCVAPFKVAQMTYTLNYSDFDASVSPPTDLGDSNNGAVTGVTLKGSGFSTQIGLNGDLVTLKVK